MNEWSDVAKILRPLAKSHRGIQKQLALRWDLSEALISRYINGETTPDPLLAARLCAALGVDLNELAGVTPSRPDVSGVADELERIAEKLRLSVLERKAR